MIETPCSRARLDLTVRKLAVFGLVRYSQKADIFHMSFGPMEPAKRIEHELKSASR
ncbi:MAG: hypothetical protein Q7J15_13060 [Candidatus Desulfaltia sp.]|nr:hypothetical protein [Candidatus Desulfaltia sp.]